MLRAAADSRSLDRAPNYTSDLNEIQALIARALPGWWMSFGLCWVSGDASLAPDYNDPAHSERLYREFPFTKQLDEGFHVDLRPGDGPSRMCHALIHVFAQAQIYIAEQGLPSPDALPPHPVGEEVEP